MAVRVLIAISIRSLGELMKQALEETGLYKAELVGSADQALQLIQSERFSLSIVDFSLVSDPAEFVTGLRDALPGLRIIVLPSDEEAEKSSLGEDIVDGWLSVPFYLPNLLDILQDVIDDSSPDEIVEEPVPERLPMPSGVSKKTVSRNPAPDWLQDVNRVAQHLTRLSLELTAQAALITNEGLLWAYAGQLPQPAAEELARSVSHYWANDGGSDLARFIRLDATKTEYMLYATSLGGAYVLALAFETEMSFTEMRTHAGDLARQLSEPPVEKTDAIEVDSAPEVASVSDVSSIPSEDPLPFIPSDWRPDQDVAEGRQAFFEDLIASMDIPAPDVVETGEAAVMPRPTRVNEEKGFGEQDILRVPGSPPEVDQAPPLAPPLEDDQGAVPGPLAATVPTRVRDSFDETKPTKLADIDVEPETQTLYNLSYACVLIPRLPRHHLVGNLASRLTEWITQLSLAFGWRLEHLSIRPDFLHWVAIVPPDSSPGLMIHNVRWETSQRVFSEFPHFEYENPSGEFWAPGYLIVNGRDPFSQQMVREFISNIRSRQGAQ